VVKFIKYLCEQVLTAVSESLPTTEAMGSGCTVLYLAIAFVLCLQAFAFADESGTSEFYFFILFLTCQAVDDL
jgi:hypothetical protein